jgi:spore coat protein CotH
MMPQRWKTVFRCCLLLISRTCENPLCLGSTQPKEKDDDFGKKQKKRSKDIFPFVNFLNIPNWINSNSFLTLIQTWESLWKVAVWLIGNWFTLILSVFNGVGSFFFLEFIYFTPYNLGFNLFFLLLCECLLP